MTKFRNPLIPIYRILHEETDDANHTLTQPELIRLLKENYQLTIDRRTLYHHIDYLNHHEIAVETFSDSRKGYKLEDRLLQKESLSILIHLLQGATFIPVNLTNEIINKLLSTQSKHIRKELELHKSTYTEHKTSNKSFINAVLEIIEAIAYKHPIEADYLKYDLNKKLISRRRRPYLLHPYHLVNSNGNLYLICSYDDLEELSFYRVDKMRNVKIIRNQPRREYSEEINPYSYVSGRPYMYEGNMMECVLRCDQSILENVLDEFGFDTILKAVDEDHFDLHITITDRGLLYWVAQFHDRVEILEPQELRDHYIGTLYKMLALYQK